MLSLRCSWYGHMCVVIEEFTVVGTCVSHSGDIGVLSFRAHSGDICVLSLRSSQW